MLAVTRQRAALSISDLVEQRGENQEPATRLEPAISSRLSTGAARTARTVPTAKRTPEAPKGDETKEDDDDEQDDEMAGNASHEATADRGSNDKEAQRSAVSVRKRGQDSSLRQAAGNKDDTSPEAAAPPKRKSRVLRRKTDHSVIERRRREKINERLIRLQEIVPACREEVLELLDKKPPKRARGANIDAEKKRTEIERCLHEEMILEKLCVISHTVDYVQELRAQVAAYRDLCQCEAPIGQPAPRDPSLHAKFAHEHGAHMVGPPSSQDATSSSLSPDSARMRAPPSVEQLPLEAPVSAGSSGPKRKRHWGSNRPPRASPPPKQTRASKEGRSGSSDATSSTLNRRGDGSTHSVPSAANSGLTGSPSSPSPSLTHGPTSNTEETTSTGDLDSDEDEEGEAFLSPPELERLGAVTKNGSNGGGTALMPLLPVPHPVHTPWHDGASVDLSVRPKSGFSATATNARRLAALAPPHRPTSHHDQWQQRSPQHSHDSCPVHGAVQQRHHYHHHHHQHVAYDRPLHDHHQKHPLHPHAHPRHRHLQKVPGIFSIESQCAAYAHAHASHGATHAAHRHAPCPFHDQAQAHTFTAAAMGTPLSPQARTRSQSLHGVSPVQSGGPPANYAQEGRLGLEPLATAAGSRCKMHCHAHAHVQEGHEVDSIRHEDGSDHEVPEPLTAKGCSDHRCETS